MPHHSVERGLPATAALIFCLTLGAQQALGTVLTVGPDGTYANIQDAIDAAVVGDDTEIRVQGANTYVENLSVSAAFSAGSLTLLGGWDSTFTNRIFSPPDTIIDGNQAGRVLDLFRAAGSVVIDGFTLTNGVSDAGGGARINPTGSAHVTLANLRIIGNTASAAGGAQGGGLVIQTFSDQRVEVLDVRIKDNLVVATSGGVVTGGGIDVLATGSSSVLIQGSEIDLNTVQSLSGQVSGAGV